MKKKNNSRTNGHDWLRFTHANAVWGWRTTCRRSGTSRQSSRPKRACPRTGPAGWRNTSRGRPRGRPLPWPRWPRRPRRTSWPPRPGPAGTSRPRPAARPPCPSACARRRRRRRAGRRRPRSAATRRPRRRRNTTRPRPPPGRPRWPRHRLAWSSRARACHDGGALGLSALLPGPCCAWLRTKQRVLTNNKCDIFRV